MPCAVEKKSMFATYEEEVKKVSFTYGISDLRNAPPDIRYKIRTAAAAYMRPIAAWAIESSRQENSGETEYMIGSFRLDDGRVQYTDGIFVGKHLTDLDKRTKELTPHLYNPLDAAINESIEERLRKGAQTVVTVYPREGKDNRDIIVMEYDKEKNTGKISVINTAVNGQYHSYTEIQKIAEKRFVGYATETTDKGSIFILHDNTSVSTPTQNVSITHIESNRDAHNNTIVDTHSEGKNIVSSALKQTGNEIIYTAESIKRFWEKRRNETRERRHHQDANVKIPLMPTQLKETQPVDTKNISTRRLHKKKRAAYALSFIQHTGVGIAASPMLIDVLSRTQDSKPKIEKGMRSKKLRNKTGELSKELSRKILRVSESHMIKRNRHKNHRIEKMAKNNTSKEQKNTYTAHIVSERTNIKKITPNNEKRIVKKKRNFEKITVHIVENSFGKIPRKERYISRQKKENMQYQERLMRFIQFQIGRVRNHETIKERKISTIRKDQGFGKQERRRTYIRNEQIAQKNLALCIAYVLLLRKQNLFVLNDSNERIGFDKNNPIGKHTILHEVSDAPSEEIESPWLLLSIIWYLTMIREQGMTQHPIQNAAMVSGTKKQSQPRLSNTKPINMVKSLNLPLSGIIFRYGSV